MIPPAREIWLPAKTTRVSGAIPFLVVVLGRAGPSAQPTSQPLYQLPASGRLFQPAKSPVVSAFIHFRSVTMAVS